MFLIGLCWWYWDTITYGATRADFAQDYYAALAARQGLPVYGDKLTTFAAGLATFSELVGNFHPPTTLLLYLPFSLMSYGHAFFLWNTISLVLYLWLLWAILSELQFHLHFRAMAMTIALYWYPFLYCIRMGQVAVVISAFMVIGWKLLSTKHETAAGLVWSVPILLKLFPALILPFLLIFHKWRAFFASCVAVTLGIACSFALIGYDEFEQYLSATLTSQVETFSGFPLNASLHGFLSSILTTNGYAAPIISAPKVAQFVYVIGAMAITGIYLSWLLTLNQSQEQRHAFALTLVTMLILSPLTWTHNFIIILLPLLLLIHEASIGKRRWGPLVLAFAALSTPDVYMVRWLMEFSAPHTISSWWHLILHLPFYGLLLTWWLLRPTIAIGEKAKRVDTETEPHRKAV